MKTLTAFKWSAGLAAFLALFAARAEAGSVTGRVLDPSGKPVAGAKVQWTAYRADDESLLDLTIGNEPVVLGEMATDAEGRFRVVLDKPGVSVALRVVSSGLPSIRFVGPYDSSFESSLFDIQLRAASATSGLATQFQARS